MLAQPLDDLCHQAAALRDEGHPTIVTFSPKVFLPITRLCRDSCGYCTFAQPPRPGQCAYMTLDEILATAAQGAAAGCTEALLTLGDKPELLYAEARAELNSLGFSSTVDYVRYICAAILRKTGMLPHVNAGVMTRAELAALRDVSASQGLMLESTSAAVLAPGGAHGGCPDKDPAARLDTIRAAGADPHAPAILLRKLCHSRQQRLCAWKIAIACSSLLMPEDH